MIMAKASIASEDIWFGKEGQATDLFDYIFSPFYSLITL
jgi:hypothetical protein